MKKIAAFLAVFIFLFCFASSVFAAGATLFFSPSSGTYSVGKTFSVSVAVNSGGGIGINAADGLIKFNPDFLTVVDVSNTNSVFELWTQKPAFSNAKGEVSFGGGSPQPYTGSAGVIFKINFKAMKEGTAAVTLASGSVLAADGKGTDIASSLGQGSYILKKTSSEEPKKEPEKETPQAPKGSLPILPEIKSDTHKEEGKWYSNNDPKLFWEVPVGITAIKYSIDGDPSGQPSVVNAPPISEKVLDDLPDGTHYFHLRFQNPAGWGSIAHKKLLIDSKPPEKFKVDVDNEGDNTNPVPILKFETIDAVSGVEYYDVKIGGETVRVEARDFKKDPYRFHPLIPGEYEALITAVDRAGNSVSASAKFVIEPLKTPNISEFPNELIKGDVLIIRGDSIYPNAKVKFFFQKDGRSIEDEAVVTDNGSWIYFKRDNLDIGDYEFWLKVVDSRGAESLPSEKRVLKVMSPSWIDLYYRWLLIILLIIIIILITYVFYLRRKYENKMERLKKEVREMKDLLGGSFVALREEIEEKIEFLDKKSGLTDAEKKVRDSLLEALDLSEEYIVKEIKDVEREIDPNHH